jgi:peroxiredoxin
MKPRILVLPVSALIIVAMVVWRYDREPAADSHSLSSETPRLLAPRFALYDQHSQLVKFERYLGRTEILVVFFDDAVPLNEHPLLTRLRRNHAALQASGLQVVAVSQATPHAIRQAEQRAGEAFPFPVLTDIDMQTPIPVPVHRLWGLADDNSPAVRSGVFHVDRRGMVEYAGAYPAPLDDPQQFLSERIGNTTLQQERPST